MGLANILGIYLLFTVNYAMTDMKSDDQYNIVAGNWSDDIQFHWNAVEV